MGAKVSLPRGKSKGSSRSPEQKPKKKVVEDGFKRSNFILDCKGTLTDYYILEKRTLGEGTYGSVCKGIAMDTGQARAIKTIAKNQIKKDVNRFKQEIQIMKLMDHPNIVRLFESFEDQRNVYLSMELCTGGELFDRITQESNFSEVQAALLMQQMLRALFYIHSQGIVHRDLKPENFLMATDQSIEVATLKLIDFGLACHCSADTILHTPAGTPYYVAPQVLSGKYNQLCDIWSAGVIMYVLLCGYPPFYGENDREVLAKVELGTYCFNSHDWSGTSSEAKDLIRLMLKFNPDERITAKEALEHVWIKETAPGYNNLPYTQSVKVIENIKWFTQHNRLKRAALTIIAEQLSDKEIKLLREAFISLDNNGDGQLTLEEVQEGLQKTGVAEVVNLPELLKAVDSDGSGVIDYSEFIAATMDKRHYFTEDVIWSAFRVLDLNGDGKISKTELSRVLYGESGGKISKAVGMSIEEILNEVDADGDGEIDFEEFLAMMR